MRKTPCVDGCCGPIETSSSSPSSREPMLMGGRSIASIVWIDEVMSALPFNDAFRSIALWSGRVVSFRFLQHRIVRCWLVFVIIRLPVVFAHRMIFELVPHQDPAQIGVAIEMNAVKIENLALLKFCAPPDRSKGG